MKSQSCLTLPTTTMLLFFFFNDTATTEIYTLSLHDALPICLRRGGPGGQGEPRGAVAQLQLQPPGRDRKSTRLNSSHVSISYAVFCLKKKNISRQSLSEELLPQLLG